MTTTLTRPPVPDAVQRHTVNGFVPYTVVGVRATTVFRAEQLVTLDDWRRAEQVLRPVGMGLFGTCRNSLLPDDIVGCPCDVWPDSGTEDLGWVEKKLRRLLANLGADRGQPLIAFTVFRAN